MESPEKSLYDKSQFSKNIKTLFNEESKYYYNKHKLNIKLKTMINKDKSLNDRKLANFDYGKMFHYFKIDMKKFDDEQIKRKNFFKSLYDENTRFHNEYQKNYSTNSKVTTKKIRPNIKSKTFQKFYEKHQITDNSIQDNNLFNKDPLLVTNNDIKYFYLNKEIDNKDNVDDFNDEALIYVNKLENNINRKSILNKVKNALSSNKKEKKGKKENKLSLNKEGDFPFIDNNNNNKNNDKSKKNKNIKRDSISKKYYKKFSVDIKKYNNNMKEFIEKLNKTSNDYRCRNRQISFEVNKTDANKNYIKKSHTNRNKTNIFKIFNNIDSDNLIPDYYYSHSTKINKLLSDISTDRNKRKKNNGSNCSNQIESLYDTLFEIRKNIKKYEKKNESELRFLYTYFSKNSGKKFKQSFLENQRLLKLDKELVYSVNSFND